MQAEIKRCLKIAITGAMGCGKSAASQIFRDLGVCVLDADKLCHEALDSDALVKKSVRCIFGEDCYDPGTGLARRDMMAKMAFADPKLLERLENILHPAVEKMWKEKAEEVAESDIRLSGEFPLMAVEVPLLYEKSLEKKFDVCICVYCSDKLRVNRLINRGMTSEQIASRDAFQLPSETKAAKADIVLFNETDLVFLQKQTSLVLSRLKKYGR